MDPADPPQEPPAGDGKPKFDPADFVFPGTFAARVDVQLGLLTQGVADCMILATGALPGLTEGIADQPEARPAYAYQPPRPAGGNTWQAARSAELRDAARLSEASARLLMGFARLRGEFKQDFTVRHTDDRADAKDGRRQATVVIQKFSVPKDPDAPGDGEAAWGAEIAAGFGKAMAAMAERRAPKAGAARDPEAQAEFNRRFMDLIRRGRSPDKLKQDDALAGEPDTPPPPAQS